MKLLRTIMLLILASLLQGCNGLSIKPSMDTDNNYFTVFSGFPMPGFFMASAVQWNEDYAVTVSHTPFLPYEKFSCSTKCDLVFFRHKASGSVPQWRQAEDLESITAQGASPYLLGAESQGRVFPAPFLNTDKDDGILYGIHDAPLVKGMSGGPVVAKDGKVVGINVGFHSADKSVLSSHPGLKGAKRISVFVPYSMIEREWRLLESKLK